MKIHVRKYMEFLEGVAAEDKEKIADLESDKAIFLTLSKTRNNVKLHAKLMALYRCGFEHWNLHGSDFLTHNGQAIQPEFDRFRRDITVLAGFFKTEVNFNGNVVLEPESVSFGQMSDTRKRKLYSAVIDVLLAKVLDAEWSREEVEQYVNEIVGFD